MQFKPYPEYKDSGVEWLGEVPAHWDIFKSDKIFEQSNIRAYEYDVQLTASQKYGVIPQNLYMQKEESKVVLALSGINNFKHVDQNDFVISLRSFQGGIELCHYEGCVSPAYTVLKNKKNIDQIFWSYLLKSNVYVSVLNTAVDGIREGKTISYANFGKIYINFPSLNEQNKIACFLDKETSKIDFLISKQEKLIQLLEEQRKSIISHAVTKGLNPDAPMKDSGVEWLREVPAHWEIGRLKDYSTVNPKAIRTDVALTQHIEFIPMANVNEIKGEISKIDYRQYSEVSSGYTAFNSNDVIFAKITPCMENGNCAIIPKLSFGFGFGSTEFIVFRSNLKFSTHFLYYFLRRDDLLKIAAPFMTGTAGQQRISSHFLENFPAACPSPNEQNQIVTYLDQETSKIDTAIDMQKQLIGKLKEYRTSIISYAVTGKIDVRDLAA